MYMEWGCISSSFQNKNEMNEKQVKLNEFMIAFEEKSPLILISAAAAKVTFMKKHPEASVFSIL